MFAARGGNDDEEEEEELECHALRACKHFTRISQRLFGPEMT